MKAVFMGTPDFAANTLEKLIENYEVLAVVTQPDKPKGRGQKMQFTPVKEVAAKHNIEVLQPRRIKSEPETIEYIKSLNPDVIVVVAYGQILSKEILDIPKYGCINVHASLLPSLRGAAPINWSIINGDSKTGVTIMEMNEGLDTGDMLLKGEVLVDENETAGELHDKLMHIGGDLLIEALKKMESGEIKGEKQDDSLSTYAHMMKKDLGHVNWNMENDKVHNLIRGVIPWPGAYTYLNDITIKIWKTVKVNKDYNKVPGEVVEVNKDGITVSTKKGAILITELQKVGGKRLNVRDFLNGNSINVGDILN